MTDFEKIEKNFKEDLEDFNLQCKVLSLSDNDSEFRSRIDVIREELAKIANMKDKSEMYNMKQKILPSMQALTVEIYEHNRPKSYIVDTNLQTGVGFSNMPDRTSGGRRNKKHTRRHKKKRDKRSRKTRNNRRKH